MILSFCPVVKMCRSNSALTANHENARAPLGYRARGARSQPTRRLKSPDATALKRGDVAKRGTRPKG